MVRKRQNLLKQQREVVDRRYRFRARFEQPPGGGAWKMEDNLLKWLDERIGRGNYAFLFDDWAGHAERCYALHFDDHTIIPDLLAYYASIETVIYRSPCFQGELPRSTMAVMREAILGLQGVVVDKLNIVEQRVTWVMGECRFGNGRDQTAWEIATISRINELTKLCSILSVSSEEVVRFTLESNHVGALGVCLTMARDLKPPPNHIITPLRDLLNSLVEDKGGYDVRSVQR